MLQSFLNTLMENHIDLDIAIQILFFRYYEIYTILRFVILIIQFI